MRGFFGSGFHLVGSMIAGTGMRPSHWSSSHMIVLNSRSRSMNSERLVIAAQPSSVSCTMPITGLLPCGDTITCGHIIMVSASARALRLCGTCRFISSPSKSALYGLVQLRFSRNVLQSITFA